MKRLMTAAVAAVPFLVAGGAAGADTFVRMLAGPAGGSWYPYGAKMMELVGKQMKDVATSNGPGGGVGNARNVNRKKAEFGWTFANTAYDAYTGKSKFETPHTELRFFANLYPGVLQSAVPAKSSIRSYKDLGDKRLSPGKLTFSGNIAFEKVLGLYGISYDEVKKNGGNIHRVGYKDSVALMKDGHIDVFVGLTTAPNASFIALDFSPGIRFLPVSADVAGAFVKRNPGFIEYTMPAGTYKNVGADVPTIAAPTVLITHKDVADDLAYDVARIIWESHGELVKVNSFWNNVKLAAALEGAAIPVHPGALKYYREKGVAK